jgi:hypothetical protein
MPGTTLNFDNGFAIRILTEGERFLGLGRVTWQGMPLRADVPWVLHFEHDGGVTFDDFRLRGIVREDDAQVLVLAASGRRMPRMQDRDSMGDNRIAPRRLADPVAEVRWRFRQTAMTVHGTAWEGLAWTISVACPGHPIHWLLEEATWELDGRADGCTLIQRDMSCLWPEQPVRADSCFSTREKFATAGWGGSYPMDMMPRAAGSSHLDFQSRDAYALALFAERPGMTRARIEKHADEDVIHYADRPFFPLGEQVSAPERTLLAHRAAAPLARHERRNLWLDLQAEVRDRILAPFGMCHEAVTPTLSSHLWDAELKRHGPGWRLPLMQAFPEYARLGIDTVFTFGPWDSPINDPAAHEGNICAPYAFHFAKEFGGAEGMRELVASAHAAGVKVSQWFAFHLSRRSPIYKDHPDWLLKQPGGQPYDADYKVLWTGRMRSGWGAELERQALAVRLDTGLDSIFWDSYHNLGVTAIDWGAPDKAPQADEIWRMFGRLQAAGFASQRPECVTIFGCGQGAFYGFDNDAFRRRLWSDTEANDDIFALIDNVVGFFTDGDAVASGRLTVERYFWMAAHRVLPNLSANPWAAQPSAQHPRLPGGPHAEAIGRINRAYLAALPRMVRPRLAVDASHVLWHDAADRQAVVWALADGSVPVLAATARTAAGAAAEIHGGRLAMRSGEVYLLG